MLPFVLAKAAGPAEGTFMARYRKKQVWQGKVATGLTIFALGVLAIVASAYTDSENKRAREAGVPAVVDLARFDPASDVHAAGEVHVQGRIEERYTYHLFTQDGSKEKDSIRMLVMFATGDPPDSKIVRAVLLVEDTNFDAFLQQVPGVDRDTDADVIAATVSGQSESLLKQRDLADKALRELGLTKAPGFLWIEPWRVSREADLGPMPSELMLILGAIMGLGLLIAAWGFLQYRTNQRILAQLSPEQAREVLRAEKAAEWGRRKGAFKKALFFFGLAAAVFLIFRR
jgi:hypothetical protein